jgi:hypothetical protein
MAYSSITKPEDHFNTKLTTGTGSSQGVTGVGFQPDWIWGKRRDSTRNHSLFDSVRGITKGLESNNNNAEFTSTDYYSSFDSDGFTIASGSSGAGNGSSQTAAQWCWLAGGTAPSQTYTVKVVSDSGNKYRFDDFGTSAVTLDLQEGGTYTFDQSDSSNSGHPLRFSTTSDGSHGGGSEYTTGVTTTGTPGSSGAQTVITVAASAPTLYYYCTSHSGMGGQANTNSTHGSSNFAGGTQSTVSVNSTAGFSIINWAGSSSASVQTIGHGLGATPHWILSKNRGSGSSITAWINYHHKIDTTAPEDYTVYLNNTDARVDNTVFNDTAPTSTVFSFNTGTDDQNYISYCFTEKKGFSKFGNYVGNGVASGGGPFIYTGFKPAWFMLREVTNADNWIIMDNRRLGYNKLNYHLFPNLNNADYASDRVEFRSNGMKVIDNDGSINTSGATYIYMAFAENPFVANDSATAIPTTGF